MGYDRYIGPERVGGRSPNVGTSETGGEAGNSPPNTHGEEVRTDENPFSREDAERTDADEVEGVPEDLKPGKRRTVGLDEDAGAGLPDITGEPGSTTGAE
jgi:hypothetical protein